MHSSLDDIKNVGYVNVSYPADLRSAVKKTVDAWKAFCALPEEAKVRFPYNSGDGMGVGYELKKEPGKTLDLKEDFHATLGARDWLRKTAFDVGDPTTSFFVGCTEALTEMMEPLIVGFARDLEKRFGMEGLADEVRDSKDMWFVRFIHYFGGSKEGEEIGKAHADKSGFTLHLYESDPGLQYLGFDKVWRDMPVSESETVIIPGMRGQFRSRGGLKATFHRVVSTSKTAKTGRFSAVCFVHFKRTKQYDKARAGRLQTFEPGFNYSMSFDEFAKLFTE
jgi:isopenicillin N synthase-like dioxygenase